MPRSLRASAGGMIYHVFNTAVPRRKLFRSDVDYAEFVAAMRAAGDTLDVKVLGYCLMPEHFHLVVLPKRDGDLSRFMLRVVAAHVRNYRVRYRSEAGEKLYASRFRSFPVQKDSHLLELLRFVESNPARIGLVKRAEQWKWSSLSTRNEKNTFIDTTVMKLPNGWEKSSAEMDENTVEAIRKSLFRSCPLGDGAWTRRTADKLGLASSIRPIGRPRKTPLKAKRAG